MAKVYFEALYRLATRNSGNHRSIEEVDKDFKIIEKALKDYESIDNANPSEALEEIKTLRGFNQVELNNDKNINKSLDVIEQALLKAQGQKKVLNEVLKLNGERAEKLDYYQDLEKQLGCPLEVVFKALKQDYIYTKNGKHSRIEFGTYGFEWCICYGLRTQIRVADYKKTWWLKEDKSE